MKARVLFSLSLVLGASFASAQVTEVGQFTGEFFENFNGFTGGPVGPSFDFMGGIANNTSNGSSDIWMSNAHGLAGSKGTYSDSMAMVANNGAPSPWTITFDSPMIAFGGKWQSAFDDSTLTFKFFDGSGNALNTITKTPPNTQGLVWYGFKWTGGIGKVLVTSSQPFQIVDDFTATAVPEPASMAALGLGAAALLRRRRQAP